jgi:ribosome-associated heat shock protein Hsp15
VQSTRIDKWLWAARMFKTRTLATASCDAGHVQINGETVKASKKVSAGRTVNVLTLGGPRVLEVIAIGDKRGPVAAALALFIDHTPEPEPLASPLDIRERGAGRPTKRERRKLGKVRGF